METKTLFRTPAWDSQTLLPQPRRLLSVRNFTILTEIDVRQVLKELSPSILRPYLILSACSLPLAYRAIKADDVIGSMLLILCAPIAD